MFVLAAAVLWGLIGVQSAELLGAGLSPSEIAFWRAMIAAVLFAAYASVTGGLRVPRGRDIPMLGVFALLGVTLFYTAYNLAVEAGGVSLAAILLYTAPAIVAVLAHFTLDERLTGVKIGLVALTLLGVVLVSLSGGGGVTVSVASIGWGLASALGYSTYYLIGKWALRRWTAPAMYAVVMPLGGLALLPWVTFADKGAREWLLIASLAVFSTFLAYALYAAGLARMQASKAVVVATIEPVVAALSGAVILGERLGPWAIVGGACVIAAAAAAGGGPRRRSARRAGTRRAEDIRAQERTQA